jgi:hypothetical protein
VIEFGADGRYRGMTATVMTAVDTLRKQMRGDWLYGLTSPNPQTVTEAQQMLAEAAKVFKSFTDAQRTHFLNKYYAHPSDLPTVLIILVTFGLATPTEN